MTENEDYVNSFDSEILDAFHDEREHRLLEDPDSMDMTMDEYIESIRNRLRELESQATDGAMMEAKRLREFFEKTNLMYFNIRHFHSFGGDGAIFKINISNLEESISEFLRAHGGKRLVTVDGKDVTDFVDRREILMNGPEFYMISDEPRMGKIDVNLEYDPVSDLVYQEYAKSFVEDYKDEVVKEIISLKTPEDVDNYYKTPEKEWEKKIVRALMKTKHSDTLSKYNPKTVLEAIKFDYGKEKEFKEFSNEMVKNLNKTMTSLLFCVLDMLPGVWEKHLYKGLETKRTKKEEYDLVMNMLSKVFEKSYYESREMNPYPMFIRAVNGKYDSCYPLGFMPEPEKRKVKRRKLFRRKMPPCPLCYKMSCKLGKCSRAPGVLLQFSNPTNECPEAIFNAKMLSDPIFKQRIDLNNKFFKEKLQGREIGTISKFGDVKMITVVDLNKPYNKFEHFINPKKIETFEDGSMQLQSMIGGKCKRKDPMFYHVMSNGKVIEIDGEKRTEAQLMEYHSEKYPKSLFLVMYR